MTSAAFCEACGRKASPDARFCGGCGRTLRAPAGRDAAPDDPRDGDPGDGDPEDGGAGDASAAPPRAASRSAPPEETAFDVRPVAVQSFGQFVLCLLTIGVAWIVLTVMRRSLRYRITTQRIEVVSGIANVTRRTVDLFRVQDLEVVQPLFLRLGGKGHITVRSQDAGEPVVVLHAIPDVRAVHEALRGLVAAERKRQRVRVVEDER